MMEMKSSSVNMAVKAGTSTLKVTMAMLVLFLAVCPEFVTHHYYFLNGFANYESDSTYSIRASLARYLNSKIPKVGDPAYPTQPTIVMANQTDMVDILNLKKLNYPFIVKGAMKNPNFEGIMKRFGNTRQNLFPVCAVAPEPYLGEVVPCTNDSLAEKISGLRAAAAAGKAYIGTHPQLISNAQKEEKLYDLLQNNFGVFDGAITLLNSWVWAPVLMVFYSHGFSSNVPYHHMHDDSFLSFAIEGNKQWKLLHPDFAPLMKPKWSGASLVQTAPLPTDLPFIHIEQEAGDMVFIPPFYIHQTGARDGKTCITFHMHMGNGMAGVFSGLAAELFGKSDFFFGTVARFGNALPEFLFQS